MGFGSPYRWTFSACEGEVLGPQRFGEHELIPLVGKTPNGGEKVREVSPKCPEKFRCRNYSNLPRLMVFPDLCALFGVAFVG